MCADGGAVDRTAGCRRNTSRGRRRLEHTRSELRIHNQSRYYRVPENLYFYLDACDPRRNILQPKAYRRESRGRSRDYHRREHYPSPSTAAGRWLPPTTSRAPGFTSLSDLERAMITRPGYDPLNEILSHHAAQNRQQSAFMASSEETGLWQEDIRFCLDPSPEPTGSQAVHDTSKSEESEIHSILELQQMSLSTVLDGSAAPTTPAEDGGVGREGTTAGLPGNLDDEESEMRPEDKEFVKNGMRVTDPAVLQREERRANGEEEGGDEGADGDAWDETTKESSAAPSTPASAPASSRKTSKKMRKPRVSNVAPLPDCQPISSGDQEGLQKAMDLERNETQAHAYAGFKTISAGRRFWLTPPVIKALQSWLQAGKPTSVVQMGIQYKELLDRGELEMAETATEASVFFDQYPFELEYTQIKDRDQSSEQKRRDLELGANNFNASELSYQGKAHALILKWMIVQCEAYLSKSIEEQKAEHQEFRKTKLPWGVVPEWDDLPELVRPVWQSKEYRDLCPDLEELNRAHNVLSSFRRYFTSRKPSFSGVWSKNVTSRTWFPNINIESAIPHWMGAPPISAATLNIRPKETQAESSPRRLRVIFADDVSAAPVTKTNKRKYKEALKRAGVSPQTTIDLPSDMDPRDERREDRWRDCLRNFLKTPEKLAVLKRLVFVDGYDDDGDPFGRIFWDKTGAEVMLSWDQLQSDIKSGKHDQTFTIQVWLGFPVENMQDEDDPEEMEDVKRKLRDYEYSGTLDDQTERHLKVINGRVFRKSEAIPSDVAGEGLVATVEDTESEEAEPFDPDVLKYMQDRLRFRTGRRRCPKPMDIGLADGLRSGEKEAFLKSFYSKLSDIHVENDSPEMLDMQRAIITEITNWFSDQDAEKTDRGPNMAFKPPGLSDKQFIERWRKDVSAFVDAPARKLRTSHGNEEEEWTEEAMDYQSQLQKEARKLDAGVGPQLGPSVMDAIHIFQATETGESHIRDENLKKYALPAKLFGEKPVTCKVYAHQMTGCLWQQCHSRANISELALPEDMRGIRSQDAPAKAAIKRLQFVPTMGGYIKDDTGLGKTITVLLNAALDAANGKPEMIGGKEVHRPIQILCPTSAVMKQWYDAIQKDFAAVLKPLVCHASQVSQNTGHRVSTKQLREGRNSSHPGLRAALDQSNPDARSYVLLTTYATDRERSLEPYWEACIGAPEKQSADIRPQGVSEYAAFVVPDDGTKSKKKRWCICKYRFIEEGWVRSVIMDEGQEIRHKGTMAHSAVLLRKAPINWIVSATPTLNSERDILGSLHLLWPAAEKVLKGSLERVGDEDPDSDEEPDERSLEYWYKKQLQKEEWGGLNSWKIFEKLKEMEDADELEDEHKLVALDPQRIASLLATQGGVDQTSYGLGETGLYHRFLNEAAMLVRNSNTEIPYDDTEKLSLRNLLPAVNWNTSTLERTSREERHGLFWDRLFADQYYRSIKSSITKGENAVLQDMKASTSERKGIHLNDKGQRISAATAALRMLTISAGSTRLCELDSSLQGRTLATDFDLNRGPAHDAMWMFLETTKYAERQPKTLSELVKWLVTGSPKARAMLRHYREKIMDKPEEKLLITEDVPLLAWFWELVFTTLHIPAQTLHAGLSDADKQSVIEQFKNPKSPLRVLIIEYSSGSTGLNLESCCKNVIVATVAPHIAAEKQAVMRIGRITQLAASIEVVRFIVSNTHDEIREQRQKNKQKLMRNAELVTDNRTAEKLAEWCNLYKYRIDAAYNDPRAQIIRDKMEREARELAKVAGVDAEYIHDDTSPLSGTAQMIVHFATQLQRVSKTQAKKNLAEMARKESADDDVARDKDYQSQSAADEEPSKPVVQIDENAAVPYSVYNPTGVAHFRVQHAQDVDDIREMAQYSDEYLRFHLKFKQGHKFTAEDVVSYSAVMDWALTLVNNAAYGRPEDSFRIALFGDHKTVQADMDQEWYSFVLETENRAVRDLRESIRLKSEQTGGRPEEWKQLSHVKMLQQQQQPKPGSSSKKSTSGKRKATGLGGAVQGNRKRRSGAKRSDAEVEEPDVDILDTPTPAPRQVSEKKAGKRPVRRSPTPQFIPTSTSDRLGHDDDLLSDEDDPLEDLARIGRQHDGAVRRQRADSENSMLTDLPGSLSAGYSRVKEEVPDEDGELL